MSMFLSYDELKELTGKQVKRSQRAVLQSLGIEHRTRPDGSLVVSRSHVEKSLHGDINSSKKPTEPNWGGI